MEESSFSKRSNYHSHKCHDDSFGDPKVPNICAQFSCVMFLPLATEESNARAHEHKIEPKISLCSYSHCEDEEGGNGLESIAAVIKELSERRGRASSPCLLSVNRVHRLVEEKTADCDQINPDWNDRVLSEGVIVDKEEERAE